MKNKVVALFTTVVFLATCTMFSFADMSAKSSMPGAPANPNVSLLPASDAVFTFDVKRFFGEAMPKLLSSNQPLLSGMTRKLDDMQTKTGIDFRQFDQVAVGVAIKPMSGKNLDLDPAVIASGNFNLAALVSAARIASKGTYREEKFKDKSLYVFSVKELAQKHAQKRAQKTGKLPGFVDRTIDRLSSDIAMTAIDRNTLAIGSLARIRQTVEANTHVDVELTNLLSRRPAAIMNFAVRSPAGLSKFLPLDNDEIGKNLDAIRFLAGSMDVVGNNAVMQLLARTSRSEQAQSLFDTIEGLKFIGKAFLGSARGSDKQVFARMVENAQIARSGNDVTLDLSVPQSDIDILIGKFR